MAKKEAPAPPVAVVEMAKNFAVIKEQKEMAAEKTKVINKILAALGEKLNLKMHEAGLKTLTVKGNFFVDGRDRILKPTESDKAACLAGKEKEMAEWLYAQGHRACISQEFNFGEWSNEALCMLFDFNTALKAAGHGDLIKFSISADGLSSFVGDRKSKNLPVPPKKLCSIFEKREASSTRGNKKKKETK